MSGTRATPPDRGTGTDLGILRDGEVKPKWDEVLAAIVVIRSWIGGDKQAFSLLMALTTALYTADDPNEDLPHPLDEGWPHA